MQVILLENIKNLGDLGAVVDVRAGYGRNFLIPTGKALPATKDNLATVEARRAELEKDAAEKLAAAQALGAKLSETTVQLSEKAAVDGRLFGSVTNHDIAAALNASGLKVEKAQVRMPNGALKIAGEHTVTVALHPDVVVDVKVVVAGEAA